MAQNPFNVKKEVVKEERKSIMALWGFRTDTKRFADMYYYFTMPLGVFSNMPRQMIYDWDNFRTFAMYINNENQRIIGNTVQDSSTRRRFNFYTKQCHELYEEDIQNTKSVFPVYRTMRDFLMNYFIECKVSNAQGRRPLSFYCLRQDLFTGEDFIKAKLINEAIFNLKKDLDIEWPVEYQQTYKPTLAELIVKQKEKIEKPEPTLMEQVQMTSSQIELLNSIVAEVIIEATDEIRRIQKEEIANMQILRGLKQQLEEEIDEEVKTTLRKQIKELQYVKVESIEEYYIQTEHGEKKIKETYKSRFDSAFAKFKDIVSMIGTHFAYSKGQSVYIQNKIVNEINTNKAKENVQEPYDIMLLNKDRGLIEVIPEPVRQEENRNEN